MWTPAFACPECRGAIDDSSGSYICAECRRSFARQAGIFRFITDERRERAAAFIEQYRIVRQRDGHGPSPADYYRALPVVASNDPCSAEWRIRRESYATLLQRVLAPRGQARLLDLGAGNGWLTHRLSSTGLRAVAVDRLDDDADGLGACRHYHVSFPAVQADFDRLPFPSGTFDVVVLNGALHYAADPVHTLGEARRVLADEGSIVVMDSPMFSRRADGDRMLESERRRFESEYGITDPLVPGVGYLTYQGLKVAATSIGMRSRFIPSHGPMSWRLRRSVARWRLKRTPAAFGVWVAE